MEVKPEIKEINDTLLYIGTATVQLNIDGVNLLIDPAFFHGDEIVHMGKGMKSKRLIPPAIPIDKIQPPDLILLTHTHRDHWDEVASNGLSKDIPVITTTKAAKQLRKEKFRNAIGMKPGESYQFKSLEITATPARHGESTLLSFLAGPVIGFGIASGSNKLWISGDTVGHPKLDQFLQGYAPDTGIVYFGGVRPINRWRATFDETDARQTLEKINSFKICYPVHYDDWSHFRTTKPSIINEFQKTKMKIKLVFAPRGETISLWHQSHL